MTTMTTRALLTPAAVGRIAVGWGAVAALALADPWLAAPTPMPLLLTVLGAVTAVILLCSFGVVHEAEQLARRLGDPYGSLVLTLSIVLIEVVLISAVMLGPGEHATIARDSVVAVAMIILNAVIGMSLMIGGLRHGGLRHNRRGAVAYLAMLLVLLFLAFALPAWIGFNGSYTAAQQIPVLVLALGLYAYFLIRQMGPRARDFTEVPAAVVHHSAAGQHPADGHDSADVPVAGQAAPRAPIGAIMRKHRREILGRLALLLATVLPIVLLSHTMAALLDQGLERAGAPTALAGLLIAMIVFLPETITTLRAALRGEGQRVSNLCHGALVSTVGLTIPAVLFIGLLTGQVVQLAPAPANLLLLAASLLLTGASYGRRQATAFHGVAHLALFVVYVLVLLA